MATDAPYRTEEASDLIARATEEFFPDQAGRRDAAYALVEALLGLSTNEVQLTKNQREGFSISNGGAGVPFYVTPKGAIVFGENGQHLIVGLDYDPTKKIYEGPALDGQVAWPKLRRSAVAQVAEQLLAALHAKIYPPKSPGDIIQR